MQTVNVIDYSVRAVTFTDVGQRCEMWLPAGNYLVTGQRNVTTVVYGEPKSVPAVMLQRHPTAPVFLVHPSAIKLPS